MKTQTHFDVIIIGRSYSGLAAGLALGRALRKVLIIDNGKPCNAQTPHSHNFLTRDGETPAAIAAQGRKQLEQYSSVSFLNRTVVKAVRTDKDFEVEVSSGEVFGVAKLLFATGICDLLLNVDGLADCWGISVLHCPFCHGYEVRNQKTGIIGNGNDAYELVSLIANWTGKLTVFTNGPATLSPEQTAKLHAHHIGIVEKQIIRLQHHNGHLHHIQFVDGSEVALSAAYIRSPFRQACPLPELLGCALNDEGYIQVDSAQATSIAGVFACGDNTTKIRTIANAVSSGATAGIAISRQLITEQF
ncbi:NAD(P)/FAD-dependent oxidoreductase [Mucilaginibacter sp. R-33]|uniref:NAD(P)/FAD-dependent oxidoreductase n=1 Tax=unclassified Mucilaginibacter TaxID=2617802 RepID=UPI003CF05AB3